MTPDSTVGALLASATTRLKAAHSPTPRVDATWLLSAALKQSSAWLRAWEDADVQPEQQAAFEQLLQRRLAGEPVAYILGQAGFWSLSLRVTPATLIPRPDTEVLVEQVLARVARPDARVLDLGTGTGAIALALKSERPGWRITAVDRSSEALTVARANSESLALPLELIESDWFSALPESSQFDVIVSNPPYIDAQDHHLREGDVRFEPREALVAPDAGFSDIQVIVAGARRFLLPLGWLMIEHGNQQGSAVRACFQQAGFQDVQTCQDLAGRDRVTLGQYRPKPDGA